MNPYRYDLEDADTLTGVLRALLLIVLWVVGSAWMGGLG